MISRLKIYFLIFLICGVCPSRSSAEEYLWAGANEYQLWFQYEGRIYQQLNAMQEAGLKVLRIFLGHRDYQSWEDPPGAFTFENPIGSYNDANLEKVDFLMYECQKRGIKLIIALSTTNDIYFITHGPLEMYRRTTSLNAYKNRFSYFLNHYNSYIGKRWKEIDDVMYAWEIQNEAGIPLIKVNGLTSAERHDIIRQFLSEMSTYLKSIDPDTRVSLGIAGYANYYHNGKSGDDIRTLGNIQAADIYTLHFYGGNLSQWIDDNLTYCRSINKLLFIEEFGNERKVGMQELINLYQSVARTCRTKGVPWMFWELGHRKDNNTYSINDDDEVWKKVVAPETALINQIKTNDPWDINPITSPVEMEEMPVRSSATLACYPNPFNQNIHLKIESNAENIDLRIYDMRGRQVFCTMLSCPATTCTFGWNGTDQTGNPLSSGIYLIAVQKTIAQKICLMK